MNDDPCTISFCDGKHYDLSSLSSSKSDYETVVGETSYKLNVCRGVVSELWKVDEPDDVGGFVHRESGDFSMGKVNSSLWASPGTDEPLMILQDGSPCPLNPQERASTVVRFICSPSDFSAGKPSLIATIPPHDPENACHFFFEWKSHVACPTNKKAALGKGHYIAFSSLIALAILAWFVGTTLYNRFFLKKRGMEQFPIPRHLPSLPKRSAEAQGPSWGSWKKNSRRGYNNVRADENDEEENFAGRFSLEDDDEDARPVTEDAQAWRSGQPVGQSNGNPPNGGARELVDL